MTSSIYESLREFKNRNSGCIQSGNIFIEKKLDDPAELDKNTGRYCDKKFHGLSDSQEIVHTI